MKKNENLIQTGITFSSDLASTPKAERTKLFIEFLKTAGFEENTNDEMFQLPLSIDHLSGIGMRDADVGTIFHLLTEILLKNPLKAPTDFHLDLSDNQITHVGFEHILHALENKYSFPVGFHIDLSGNKISDKGVSLLLKIIESGKYPHNFILNLNNNPISPEAFEAVKTAVHKGKQNLFFVDLDNKQAENQSQSEQQQGDDNTSLMFSNLNQSTGGLAFQTLLMNLKDDENIKNLTKKLPKAIDLTNQRIHDSKAILLLRDLKDVLAQNPAIAPENFQVDLSNNWMTDTAVEGILSLLSSDEARHLFPTGFTLILSGNRITLSESTRSALKTALSYPERFPPDMAIFLKKNPIPREVIEELANETKELKGFKLVLLNDEQMAGLNAFFQPNEHEQQAAQKEPAKPQSNPSSKG